MNLEPIVGRYLQLRYNDLDYRIFFEEAGQGCAVVACTLRARTAVVSSPAERRGGHGAFVSSHSTSRTTADRRRHPGGG